MYEFTTSFIFFYLAKLETLSHVSASRHQRVTSTIVVTIGCLLRVLPSLSTGPSNVAWDIDQHGTLEYPTSVSGLAGKHQGNIALKTALVALFYPLLMS